MTTVIPLGQNLILKINLGHRKFNPSTIFPEMNGLPDTGKMIESPKSSSDKSNSSLILGNHRPSMEILEQKLIYNQNW